MSGGGFYSGKGGKGGKASASGGSKAPAATPGIDIPGAIIRKLKALGYPDLANVSLAGQAFCKIVLWLEEEKIRYYDKADRRVLRDFNRAWYQYAADYCQELGVPAEGLDEKNMNLKLSVLNGLTNLAIHDVYRDKVEANELEMVAPPKSAAGTDGPPQKLLELIAPLNRLLEYYALPMLPTEAADTDTLAALQCIHARLCPPPPKDDGEQLDLDQLPVGLHIDDPEVKKAACVLRLLHGNELRDLQVHINKVINELQQLTADPKTDARLGRVGR